MNYKKLNNITGWVVFLIATVVYMMTVERTASFWDCGEFIAAAYKLEVPHPPGAPLFLLVGRMFSFLASSPEDIAYCINLVSVFTSSFSILFLFWTIAFLAKKIIAKGEENPEKGKQIAILMSAAVGSLAYTFSDTFWFSAVESEVYAFSSFFTAFIFWAIFKWEVQTNERDANKWLIMIMYMTGLSIGVHLLNLVALPALALVYYFKKYEGKISLSGGILAFFGGLVIVGIINNGVIPGLPSMAGKFELFFVNSMNMPIGTGILIFVILFFGALVTGIVYSVKKDMELLNTGLLAFAFVLIGYFCYMIIPVRSSYNPPIDENNPEDIMSFVSYLKREQYGDRPLLYGPTAKAKLVDQKEGEALYRRKGDKYVEYNRKLINIYDDKHKSLFPRIYNAGSVQTSSAAYKSRGLDLDKKRKITLADNVGYFVSYQLRVMYWRYFMWNFAGRAHDMQGADWLTPFASNEGLPHRVGNSMARNQFYMLPLLLGIVGLLFQYKRDQNNFIVTLLLFFFTGIALVIFLNSPPNEPRERDYIYVGSFYAFAIWIGLGVLGLFDLLKGAIKNTTARAGLTAALSLTVPAVMAVEGWDDHDRSGRWHSVDSAKNLLNACAKNAILFTGGDNDTFPLWYVQEVEGFRTDVRVCNLSLLNTDWYIDLMRQDAYDSKGLPITFEKEQYISGTNDVIQVYENPGYKNGISLKGFVKAVQKKSKEIQMPIRGGGTVSVVPSRTFKLPIDREKVLASGIIPKGYEEDVPNVLKWKAVGKSRLEKKQLIMLDMLANNNWERPIYFSTTVGRSEYLGLADYMQMEGLALRVLPVRFNQKNPTSRKYSNPGGYINTDIMYKRLVEDSYWKGLDDETRFFNENYLRFPTNSKEKFYKLANELYVKGDKEKAKEVIYFCLEKMPDKSIPFNYSVSGFVDLLYKLKDTEKADEISNLLIERAKNTLKYYSKNKDAANETDGKQVKSIAQYTLQTIGTVYQSNGMTDKAKEVQQLLMQYR